ncbi:signal peptidase II [candidate division KSB1 bacterium]|nr:signal peptidase II [candidate division KSB1 bacterium]
MKTPIKLTILATILLLCTGCDLATKWLAAGQLKYSQAVEILPNVLELRYTENTAIAFSMLRSVDQPLRSIIIYTSSILAFVVLGIVSWQFRKESILWLTALTLIFSGAIGNLVDRLMNGYVVDFIHVHYKTQFSWPIFNVADSVITIGAIVLAILMMLRQADEKKELVAAKSETTETIS